MTLTAKPPMSQITPGYSPTTIGDIPGAPVSTSTDPVAAAGSTLTALQAGSLAYKYIVAIEGYKYLLTDAATAAAVVAWSGTDYQSALGGLYVELDNEQSIDPWQPFQGGGRCTLRVQADANDTFGIDTHRKANGAEALLSAAANRVGTATGDPRKAPTSANVQPYLAINGGGRDFNYGDAFCGTECIEVSSADPMRINTSRRGKYSPFASGGSGGRWFAQHHRVAADTNGVLLNPVVSQQPRTWIGKLVGVYIHKVDYAGNLCSVANAQRVFAGRIVGISDDAETGYTVVELEHVLTTITTTPIGRDIWSGALTQGLYIASGRVFKALDVTSSTVAARTANDLTVVQSGAAGTNQINAGYYSLGDLCTALNAWLGAESVAARLYGVYTWLSPVTTGAAGLKTKCYWKIANAGTTGVGWRISMSLEIATFLGLVANDGTSAVVGGAVDVTASGASNTSYIYESSSVPWLSAMPRAAAAWPDLQVNIENERGTCFDQYAWLPSIDKPTHAYLKDQATGALTIVDASTLSWGIFLIDEKYLYQAAFYVQSHTTTLTNIRMSSYKLPGIDAGDSDAFIFGAKASDANQGPTKIRQVYFLEGPFNTVVKTIMYTSGTTGFNHPTFDNLGYGLGVGLPGGLLGAAFELSVDSLPGAALPAVCVIDEPTTLADLFGADLVLRRGFLIWKNGGLQFGQWVTPTGETAVAALTESNKAEPSGNIASHRSATVLDDSWVRNVVKIDYNRDITLSKDGNYQSSLALEDHVSVDDSSNAKVATLKARNTYSSFANTGAGLETLLPNFLATLPLFSRPARRSTRSIDIRYFEGYAPGDVVLITDAFMRDPATGTRGVSSRAGIITRMRYSFGGPTPGDPSQVTPPIGEVDIFFLDLHRSGVYAPCAQIDPFGQGGTNNFNRGYNSLTLQLVLQPHAHSEPTEPADYTRFAARDRVLILEVDPIDPNNPLFWRRTIVAIDNIYVTINEDLLGWDPTRTYRMTYDRYSAQQGLQQGHASFAAYSTGKIERTALPYQWSSTAEPNTYTKNAGEPAELLSTVAFGDGAAVDVGHERGLIRTLNNLIDYKTAHQLCVPIAARPEPNLAGQFPNYAVCIQPIFLGLEMLSSSVFRQLLVAPLFRNHVGNGGTATCVVTLSRARPVPTPGATVIGGMTPVTFSDVISTAQWSTTSGTMVVGSPPATLWEAVKGVDGMAWLTVEIAGNNPGFGGLVQCTEGPRLTLGQ